MSFSTFNLHPSLLRGVADLGFTQPTPIQTKGIPPGLEGRDVLGCAMTGSGKTAAFVLPVLQRFLDNPKRGVTRALVVAPTRELAAQIVEHFNDLGRHTQIKAAAVYGGVGMEPQERAFRRGVDVIVACPGRLLDHLQRPYARLDNVEILVLDEVDRMLDMGFLPDIKRVLSYLPAVKQTLFFSATLPAPIAELARQLLRNPVPIDIERPSAPATGVEQAVFPVRQEIKPGLLLELLRRGEIGNALVFTRTKHRANRLADYLERHGIACDRVHGNRSQAQRTQALAAFKNGRSKVLVATDVAARGIDIEALSHVVNFDVPNVPDDYIHRVGRTARAGATGQALTFVSPEEMGDLRGIERVVGKTLPRRTLDGFDYQNKPVERFEIPVGERIAEIRARKAEDRARAAAKAARKTQASGQPSHRPASSPEHRPRTGDVPASSRKPFGRGPESARPQAGAQGARSHGARPHGAQQPARPARASFGPPRRRQQ
jgi:ATP-dependent RNA helicase RhlE